MTNPLLQLQHQGQAVWLDSIQRGHLLSGELTRLIEEDGLRGETANPTIFEHALDDPAGVYDAQLDELIRQGLDANAIYERIATDDVRMACDLFRPLYDRLGGADGFVSLEVSSKLAYDTQGTLAEVRRFWDIVARPNLMIKIPGTPEGVAAIEEALYAGINVNVTLLFSVDAYEEVTWAYIRALERRVAEGKPIDSIASVASFFVSRIDTLADQWLDEKIGQTAERVRIDELADMKGKVGIANAKIAYHRFQQICADPRFQALQAQGARVQRPLWASTSTKNPAYPDVMYGEALIGPDTINTMPLKLIAAFRDHGVVERTLDRAVEEAQQTLHRFAGAGFSLERLTAQTLNEGVTKFDDSLDRLLKRIDARRNR
ncbi:MAG: transaldolase [Caldilineaceae bacterium]|nr:transaldolase [Caldilineaceae bacterium]